MGCFVMLPFYCKNLKKPSRKNISDRLKSAPRALSSMYEVILERLDSDGNEEKKEMRDRIFLWVAMAFRPLTLPEMQYACVTEDGKDCFDPTEKTLPSKEEILEACGSLVEISEEDTLRLAT
ncbi:hypothetical protein BDD12DRAFT_34782 [Trichophaea hybrida]|nr:hypothetical protein BDD12DRAFT_34782 [Trichophaea hybrida]